MRCWAAWAAIEFLYLQSSMINLRVNLFTNLPIFMMVNYCLLLIVSVLNFLNLVLGFGFPVCPENGLLNCLNDTDFTIFPNSGAVLTISNCVYVGCPSFIIDSSTLVINNVTFRDSVGPSIAISSESTVNVSDAQFFNSSVSVDGIFSIFNAIRCLFTSSRLVVSGSRHNIGIEDSEFLESQSLFTGGAISINSTDHTISFSMSNCLLAQNLAGKFGGALYLKDLSSAFIWNSTFMDNYAISYGAIYVSSNYLQIMGCKFIGNSAINVGAIQIEKGRRALLENSIFAENTALLFGAAVLFYMDSVVILNCHFEGNSAYYGVGTIYAGRISNYLLVDSCTFLNNSSPSGISASMYLWYVNSCSIASSNFTSQSSLAYGGSIYSWQSNTIISNCTFADCSCQSYGGVMYLTQSSTCTISNTNFKRTSAYEGGVIYASHAKLSMINCTQSDSQVYAGAALVLDTSIGSIQNCLFMNNLAVSHVSASHGGAIVAEYSVVSIQGSYFYNGSATLGGQIYTLNGRVSISNCTFDQNSALDGGFLYLINVQDNFFLTITSCVISNSFAYFVGGSLALLSTAVSNIVIQECSFYNSSSVYFSGQMQVQNTGPVIFRNCNFVNSLSSKEAIGAFNAITYFTNCLFLNSVSLHGDGNLGIQSTVYLNNCTFTSAKSLYGGFATATSDSSLIVSSSQFSGISAYSGGIVYGLKGSFASFTDCKFESVNAYIIGVIGLSRGYLEVTDCEIHGLDYSSSLFYGYAGGLIAIQGLRIDGNIPDVDGSIVNCLSSSAFVSRLSFSTSQSILQSVFTLDSLSSITISDSVFIDIHGTSLIKATSSSIVNIINCSISYSQEESLLSMEQVISLENGCSLFMNSSEIENFKGNVAVILSLEGSSFNCSDSTIAGTKVPESAIKLYNGLLTSNNCTFEDNISTGIVNECITKGLEISIAGVGGALFGYSSSIILTGQTEFSGNEADLGGAIYCVNCELTFDDVIMLDNIASLQGGAVWCDSSNALISKCLVSGNEANNLSASNNFFLSSGRLSRSSDSSNISIYIGDDSLSNYILQSSPIASFDGFKGLARSLSILEYSDTININSTSDFLPPITIVARDVFDQIVFVDPNKAIIIQISLEGNNYSSYLTGESSKLMVTEKVIFSDLEIREKRPGAFYNITVSSLNIPEILPKSISVFFQECDSKTQVLVKGSICVPLLIANSSVVIAIISMLFAIIFTVIGITLFYLFKFRHDDLIKVNSFVFLFASGIGSLMAVSAPLCFLFDIGCIPGIVLERIGFTLVFAALSLKVYRIHMVFNSASRQSLQNSRLVLVLGSLVALVSIYLIIWIMLDPPKVTLTYSSQLNAVIKNSCPLNSPFAIILEVAQFSAVLILSYLAFLTRGIPERFNEAKTIGFACYNWLLLGSFFYLMAEYLITDPGLKLIFKALSIYTSHLIITVSLISVKAYGIYKTRPETEEEGSLSNISYSFSLSMSFFSVFFLKTSNVSVTESNIGKMKSKGIRNKE